MGTQSMDSMLQLAAEAFQSKNFDLAAEIYEWQLLNFSEPSARHELFVKRADALAFSGRLSEAFEIYQKASENERLRPAQLENLIECLSNTIKRKERVDGQNSQHVGSATECGRYDAFACMICCGFLCEPVTLPCGHSFCKKCLDKEKTPVCCKECNDSSKLADVESYRVNVVLNNMLSKWFPSQLLAVKLRHEGNGLYAEKKMGAALEKYNEAIRIAPRDHVLFTNRSQINSSLKNFEDALKDAEMACKLMPLWLKGHIRKAQALLTLGKTEEALTEYLFCICLEPENKLAKSEAQKLLSDLFAPVPDHVQNKILDCTNLLSFRSRIKGISSLSTGINSSPKSSKDFKVSISRPIALDETLRSMPTLNERRGETADALWSSAQGDEGKGVDQADSPVCHPTVIDRSLLLKRKRSADGDGPLEGGGTVKRPKPEPGHKEGLASWCAVVGDLLDPSDLECSLCMRLLYEPVTTPCGHTFCLKCLERCLDHNPKCPLCKEDLSEYLAQRQYCKTSLMEDLICKYLPAEFYERQKANEEEMAELSNLKKNVPIFVCTMAFPTVPCPLHIFEPCYRLMIRRCMETGTKQFGMCLSDSLKGFADYGCILEIRNVEFFADGRSVVDTIGKRRFKVVQHSQRDGYNTADIEYLEDVKVEGVAEKELQILHDAVYDQALIWVNSLKAEQKDRIVGHFGPMPEKDSEPQVSPNGPSWCWWLVAVLPLEGRAQLPFLALTSLKDRLSGIRRVLLFMSHNCAR